MNRLFSLYFVSCLMLTGCNESLPLHIVPVNTLVIDEIISTQGAQGNQIVVAMFIVGRNSYDETFQDTINLHGELLINWPDNQARIATLPLNNINIAPPTNLQGNILTIEPDGKFYLRRDWYLMTDSGADFRNLLDYSNDSLAHGIQYALQETLVCSTQLTVYRQTGNITSAEFPLILNGFRPEPTY